MEPSEYCRLALRRLGDWVPGGADHAAVAVLLSHFVRTRPSEPLFLASLRALARDPDNGSLAAAAVAIAEGWRAAKQRAAAEAQPITRRPEDQPAPEAGGVLAQWETGQSRPPPRPGSWPRR